MISRHYNTDDQMLPLMLRILHELMDKVTSEVGCTALHCTICVVVGVVAGWVAVFAVVVIIGVGVFPVLNPPSGASAPSYEYTQS